MIWSAFCRAFEVRRLREQAGRDLAVFDYGIMLGPVTCIRVEADVVLPDPANVICRGVAINLPDPGDGLQFTMIAPQDASGSRCAAAFWAYGDIPMLATGREGFPGGFIFHKKPFIDHSRVDLHPLCR